jgi:hypothetical protein
MRNGSAIGSAIGSGAARTSEGGDGAPSVGAVAYLQRGREGGGGGGVGSEASVCAELV